MYANMFTMLLEKKAKKEKGRVKWVDDLEAKGVISSEKGIDFPFYCESIGFELCKTLREGDEVEFEVIYKGLDGEASKIRKPAEGKPS